MQIPLFELSISKYNEEEIAIRNNRTGKIANQGLKPLKVIKKEFKANLCDRKQMYFSFVGKDSLERMKQLLPTTKLTC